MCLDDGRPSRCMCMSISLDDAHGHLPPKYQSYSSTHVQTVSRSWIGHNKALG